MAVAKKKQTTSASKEKSRIGPMIKAEDDMAREALITARIKLLFKHPFFGNLATRLKLINADEWCSTAATDGLNFYYNSRFVNMLSTGEVVFLVGHEILHCCYDHMDRRQHRDPMLFNIACDYAVNADLKKHQVGTFITTVGCLYDEKYEGWTAENIYDDLFENATQQLISLLGDNLLDDHMDGVDGSGEGEGDDKDGTGKSKRPAPLTPEEREAMRRNLAEAIISAANQCDAGQLPAGIQRLIKNLTDPVMNWKELIQTSITSSIRSDYSWMRPSRRAWHMDAVLPGMIPGDEIEVDVYIDMSGSISEAQGRDFVSEVLGMVESFDGYKVRVSCFDTKVYNSVEFNSDNNDDVSTYELAGGGGTDFECIFDDLKERDINPKLLVVFTDGFPCGSWGIPDYCETLWVIHGSTTIIPPFGRHAYYDEAK